MALSLEKFYAGENPAIAHLATSHLRRETPREVVDDKQYGGTSASRADG